MSETISKRRKVRDIQIAEEPLESEVIFQLPERKTELIRLILQGLKEFGYETAASCLENESGIRLEPDKVKRFREGVLDGQWDDVASLVPDFCTHDKNEKHLEFSIKEQKFLELIESANYRDALDCLRNEVVPLQQDEQNRAHVLASYLLCSSAQELYQAADWKGSSPQARQNLLYKLQSFIPPDVMVPPGRLQKLITQGLSYQVSTCKFHRSFDEMHTLLQDHCCDESPLPFKAVHTLDDHPDEVWDISYSSSGQYIAVLTRNRLITIWQLTESGLSKKLVIPNCHETSVECCKFSPDDTMLLTGGSDCRTKVWNANSGLLITDMKEHSDKISSVGWVSEEKFLTGGVDRKLLLCNKEGAVLYRWEIRVRQIDVALQAQIAAVSNAAKKEVMIINLNNKLETGIEDESILSIKLSRNGEELLVNTSFTSPELHLWNLASREIVQKYKGHSQEKFVLQCCFGGRLQDLVLCGSEDGAIFIWNKLHGTLLTSITGHIGPVNVLSWSPLNSLSFISGGDDHVVKVWSLDR